MSASTTNGFLIKPIVRNFNDEIFILPPFSSLFIQNLGDLGSGAITITGSTPDISCILAPGQSINLVAPNGFHYEDFEIESENNGLIVCNVL